jgi:hypothetical protein
MAMTINHRIEVKIKKTDAAKQIVYGEVYIPYALDSQGDYATPSEIETMAHNFLKSGRNANIDTEHDLIRNGSNTVESFVAREGDPDFTPGSWVLGTHIPEKEVWAKVESGEINGYSMYGSAVRVPKEIEIELPDDGVIKGETLAGGDETHSHEFTIRFDANGTFLGGETNEVNGHTHTIKKGSATEGYEEISKAAKKGKKSHNHRYDFVSQLYKAEEVSKGKSVKKDDMTVADVPCKEPSQKKFKKVVKALRSMLDAVEDDA